MINFFGVYISNVRFFWSVVIPKMFSLSVNSYSGRPLACIFWFCNTKKSTRQIVNIGRCTVSIVDRIIRKTKIANPIVSFFSIKMVNMLRRLLPINHCPSYTMCVFNFSFVEKYNIPSFCNASYCFCGIFCSIKNSCFLIVNKISKISIAHAVALLCNGLRSNGLVLTHRAVAPL